VCICVCVCACVLYKRNCVASFASCQKALNAGLCGGGRKCWLSAEMLAQFCYEL
jgi:hypothetical protein